MWVLLLVQLVQELEGHKSFVNAICFDDDGEIMFSGDADGVIRIWNVHTSLDEAKTALERPWTLHKTLDLPDNKVRFVENFAVKSGFVEPEGRLSP